MKSKYVLKEVSIRSENSKKDGLELYIAEGDIILDKGFGFEVLPAKWDFTKPITRKMISGTPARQSERLLRIKELGEDSAVVAILGQETDFDGKDTLVIKETEGLKTVKYGEEFTVYAKMQACDSPFSVNYRFIISDESKPKVQNFCTECGAKVIKGDKFCRECGAPVCR